MEKHQLSNQLSNNDDADRGVGEEFYEKIEAPKFVDFTAPDPYHPDDRFWFCLRVGCDQKHEEEMDPEAISKNFVLRVMAARSPYIRLQEVLNRKASRVKEKCPLSAPAKPSTSRISRLALISSVSQKMADAKGKVKPLPKLGSTPHAKGKQVAAKYLTTPRNKKCLQNPNSFRSIQNPKPTNIAVPRNRMVAKALVFGSPKKKAISIKTSSELRTPLTKICERMKRLEITSQRKCTLGYSNKLSKDIRRDPNTALHVDPSRRQLGAACWDKNKAKALFSPPNCKKQEPKSLRRIERKSKRDSNKPSSLPKETVENYSSDMEFDKKSREGSVLGNLRTNEGNAYEEPLATEKASGSFDSIDHTQEPILCVDSDTGLTDLSRSKMNSSSNSEEGCLEEHDFSSTLANPEEGNESSEGIVEEEKTKENLEKRERRPEDHRTESQTLGGVGHKGEEAMDTDDKGNALASEEPDFSITRANPEGGKESSEGIVQEEKTKENLEKREEPEDPRTESQTLGGVGHKGEEAMDTDDKENTLASDGNRDFCHNRNHSGRKILGKQKTNKITKKDKKEGLTIVATGAQGGMRYKKPKPTNPKPFRLRTDERGILKEANLEKRMQSLNPQKGTAMMISMLPGGISYRMCGNEIQRNGKCLEESSKCNPDVQESSGSVLPGGISYRMCGNEIQRNGKCLEESSKCNPDVQESSGSVLGKFFQKDEPKQVKTVGLRSQEGQMRQKIATITTPQRRSNSTLQKPKPITSRLEYSKDVKSENSLRKTKSPSLQGQQFLGPIVVASMRKAMPSHLTCGGKQQLSVINEASLTPSRSEEARERSHCDTGLANNAGTSAPRSLSQGKRPMTIPKEPNFQNVHIPKSCTRKMT